jgi:hypothetical protein
MIEALSANRSDNSFQDQRVRILDPNPQLMMGRDYNFKESDPLNKRYRRSLGVSASIF